MKASLLLLLPSLAVAAPGNSDLETVPPWFRPPFVPHLDAPVLPTCREFMSLCFFTNPYRGGALTSEKCETHLRVLGHDIYTSYVCTVYTTQDPPFPTVDVYLNSTGHACSNSTGQTTQCDSNGQSDKPRTAPLIRKRVKPIDTSVEIGDDVLQIPGMPVVYDLSASGSLYGEFVQKCFDMCAPRLAFPWSTYVGEPARRAATCLCEGFSSPNLRHAGFVPWGNADIAISSHGRVEKDVQVSLDALVSASVFGECRAHGGNRRHGGGVWPEQTSMCQMNNTVPHIPGTPALWELETVPLPPSSDEGARNAARAESTQMWMQKCKAACGSERALVQFAYFENKEEAHRRIGTCMCPDGTCPSKIDGLVNVSAVDPSTGRIPGKRRFYLGNGQPFPRVESAAPSSVSGTPSMSVALALLVGGFVAGIVFSSLLNTKRAQYVRVDSNNSDDFEKK
ncbi:hypothetical protein BJ742DRAFT_832327 [Cladochytrium replicatum]|nr:hypothetical protein BJ742DRAFT_832327 [Cladochytrium replicatum]